MSIFDLMLCEYCGHWKRGHMNPTGNQYGAGRCKEEGCDCMWFRSPTAPNYKEKDGESDE